MSPPARITMRNIAARLNVDPSTVSLALRNDPRISLELREKVRLAADELGYLPDPMLGALAHYRRNKAGIPVAAEIAWIDRWKNPAEMRNFREFDLYWKGAFEEATGKGYHLEPFFCEDSMSLARLEGILRSRNIQGILLPPHPARDWNGLAWERFSIVRFGNSIPNIPGHVVAPDQMGSGQLAYQKMRERGYSRIGYVLNFPDRGKTMFYAGYLGAQALDPGDFQIPLLELLPSDPAGNRQRLAEWLTACQPDAIFTEMAELRDLLREVGFQVPADIGLATSSVLDGNADAGINQHSEKLGHLAVELLISQIENHLCRVPGITRMSSVKADWVDGGSLPRKYHHSTV